MSQILKGYITSDKSLPDNDDVTVTIDSTSKKVGVNVTSISDLVQREFDYIDLDYTGSDLTLVTYKKGGAGGTTVCTITLTYSGGNLDTITVSRT